MKNPLTKIGKILSVKLKNALEKLPMRSERWKIRSVKMENVLCKYGKSAR
jgi:hypothetical protein